MSIKAAILTVALLSASGSGFVSADTYTLDPDHTFPSLEFAHMGLSIWRGKFNESSGTLTLDRVAKAGSIEVVVNTASIDFGLASMNEFAVKENWLETAKYPTMTYSGALRFEGDKPVAVDGQLTLRGVTKPLELKINSAACIQNPFLKKEVCGTDAEGDLNRADFGMTLYSEGEGGKIHVRIQVEAIKDD